MKARLLGVTLSGERNQCAGCDELFNSVSAFDLHRTGPYGGGRRCLSPEEMRAKGMGVNLAGFWIERSMRADERSALRESSEGLPEDG